MARRSRAWAKEVKSCARRSRARAKDDKSVLGDPGPWLKMSRAWATKVKAWAKEVQCPG